MYGFVVNAAAGSGKGLQAWESVRRRLEERNAAYEVCLTADAAEAAAAASRLAGAEGIRVVSAVGGDGTLQGVASGLAGSGTAMGIIPAGTGNDLARAWGIPLQPLAALETVLNGTPRSCDWIEFGGATCLNSVAVGFDGLVAERVNRSWYKRWLSRLNIGAAAYAAGFFDALVRYKPCRMEIEADGARHRFRDTWLVAIANTANYGGGIRICPPADPADGLLHLCVVHGIRSRAAFILIFVRVLAGRHLASPSVTVIPARTAVLRAESAVLAYGDGEKMGEGNVMGAAVRPGAFSLMV